MPTPERLVSEDMLPDQYDKPPGGEMDNKVANFLAVCNCYTSAIAWLIHWNK